MKISSKHIILFFLMLIYSSMLLAQESQLVVNRLSFEDGLSNRKINNVCQDSFGFIWIATENGLNRYDGHSIKQYFSDGSGLRKNDISEIYADKRGRIWCIHYKKYINVLIRKDIQENHLLIDVFDPQTESFQPFDSLSNSLKENKVASFYKTIDGELYLSTVDGRIYNSSNLSRPFVSLPKDRPFFNFILTENGIWTNGKKQLSHYSFDGQLLDKEEIDIQALNLQYRDENSIWVIPLILNPRLHRCWEMYVKYNDRPTSLYELDFEDKPVYRWQEGRITATLENELEVHVHQGTFYIYDTESKRILQEFKLKAPSIDYLPYVEQLFKDRTGMIWISTSFGVFNIAVLDRKFKTILQGNSTRSIFQLNEDSLMISTYDGTFIQDTRSKQIERTKNPFLKSRTLVGVGKDRQGNFFVSGHSSSIWKMNPQGEITDHFQFPLYKGKLFISLPQPYLNPSKDELWLASNNGLFKFDEHTRKREPFLDEEKREVFEKRNIQQLSFDDSGMWVMTDSGFYLVNEERRVTEIFWNEKSVGIRNMHKDAAGVRWLVVLNNGILRWDLSTGEMIHLNANNGLSNNNIYIIYEDDFGYLWLPSDYGLMRMNKQDFSVQTFLIEDGIAHNEFNHTSHFKDEDGLFYFGGLNGVTCFDPADFVQAPIVLENLPIVTSLKFIKKGKEEQEDRTALLRNEQMITLSPEDQSFILEMTIANYLNPEKQYFAYQIEGLEDTWTEMKENFVRINRLPYGNYNILLKARHLGGQWPTQNLSIPLHVKRPIYLVPWFLGLLVLVALGLIGLTIRWRLVWLEKDKERLEEEVVLRTEKIEEQKRELKALNQTKDQFFAIIAHDLRGPVISFRGLSKKVNFLIRKKQMERLNELGESIDNAASNLEKLLDNLLNWALIQNGSLPFHPKMMPVQPTIKENLTVFQGMYESKSITVTTNLEEGLQVYADANGLSAIIRNMLSNAIKYAEVKGNIWITTCKNNQHALIQIEDSGGGMSDELIDMVLSKGTNQHIPSSEGTIGEKGTGLGLQLCKELIELHNGSLEIFNTKQKQGLTVRVQLPLYQI